MPYEPSDKIGALTDAELAAFLDEPWNGRIATITPEGWPYVAPVWYEFERARRAFLVEGRERAQWIAHIRVNPRVAFHVADDLHAQHTDPPPLAPLPGPRRPPVRRAHHPAPARAGAPGARELDHLDGARVAPALPVRRHTSCGELWRSRAPRSGSDEGTYTRGSQVQRPARSPASCRGQPS